MYERIPFKTSLILLTSGLTALLGCSHYGFADRPEAGGEGSTDSPVVVTTLVAEAHQGLDLSSLTGHLVEMLRREGMSTAGWGDARNGGTNAVVEVGCQVEEAEVMGFGVHLTATSAVSCVLRQDGLEFDRVIARGTASRPHPEGAASSLIETHRRLEEDAVLDALSRISPQIARRTASARQRTPDRIDE